MLPTLVVPFFAGPGALATLVAPVHMHTRSVTLQTFATLVMLTYTGISLLPALVVPVYSKSGALPTSLDLELLATLVALVWAKLHFCQLQLHLS